MGSKTTVVLGASPKKDRYSNKAMHMLREYGHKVVPVHPAFSEIDGIRTCNRLQDIGEDVDTLTLYVGAKRSEQMVREIIGLRPRRVIFNPGAESGTVRQALEAEAIHCEEACTLVLLKTGQF
ncbi:CoA-binding protein [Desulfoplanes sp.]